MARPYSQTRDIWRRLRRNRGAVGGLLILGLLAVLAILAPLIAPADPLGVVPTRAQRPPGAEVWLGADHLGRDILSRLLYGARVSLVVGLMGTLVAGGIGTAMGILSGYLGGLLAFGGFPLGGWLRGRGRLLALGGFQLGDQSSDFALVPFQSLLADLAAAVVAYDGFSLI